MKKTYFIAVLALLLPLSTHAAWWNPADWFAAHPEVPTSTPVDLPKVQEEVEPVTPPVAPVATTTTKTVVKYVTDPDTAMQVTALMQENRGQGELIVLLQNQIAALQEKIALLTKTVAPKSDEPYVNDLVKAPMTPFCTDLLNESDRYRGQAEDSDAKWRSEYAAMGDGSSSSLVNKEAKRQALAESGPKEVERLMTLSKASKAKFDSLCK